MIANPILSVFFNILVIFFIIKFVELFDKKIKLSPSVKFWAALLYLIAVFGGIGIPYFFLMIIGIGWVILNISIGLFILLFTTLIIFIFQRNFIIYPFFAIFTSIGMCYLIDYRIRIKGKYISYPKIFSYIFISISVMILILSSTIFPIKFF